MDDQFPLGGAPWCVNWWEGFFRNSYLGFGLAPPVWAIPSGSLQDSMCMVRCEIRECRT